MLYHWCPRLYYRLLTLCPAPTDPVPLGQLWPTGPIYSLYTAYIQPIYSQYTAYIQPIYSLYTAYIQRLHKRAHARWHASAGRAGANQEGLIRSSPPPTLAHRSCPPPTLAHRSVRSPPPTLAHRSSPPPTLTHRSSPPPTLTHGANLLLQHLLPPSPSGEPRHAQPDQGARESPAGALARLDICPGST